jgi:hypothetical protein
MTAVDFDTQAPVVAGAAPNDVKTAQYSCVACGEVFATAEEQRAHFKSERHVYNTKRKQAGLKPISQEAWERKLRESRGAGERKGTAHLKANKPSRKVSDVGSQVPSVAGDTGSVQGSVDVNPSEGSAPLTPRSCLFDRKRFPSVELNLAYMEKTYSFFIPDQEYCTSIIDFLGHLGQKVSEDHACIHCNRRFPDLQSVRRHMVDKGHTQLASEARTRRGNYDEDGTQGLQDELEPFFDFNPSMREVADRIQKPAQKVASILRFFDADKDEKLGPDEVQALWAAASDGGKLSEAQYEGACAMCEVNPKDGLDVEALGKLYASGLADLDEHFKMLQELLIKRKKKPLKAVLEEDEDDDDEADGEGAESDGEDDDDEEGDESEDDEDEVVECEDEDEFEEVMRVLGLQRVTVTDTGDLRLPNGSVATHRDVSYIYRQRGVRPDQQQLQAAQTGKSKHMRRAQLMLSAAGSGNVKMALSQRQEARQGRMIIAILRNKHNKEFQLGMSMNVVNKAIKGTKIRTGRGDMSNGR